MSGFNAMPTTVHHHSIWTGTTFVNLRDPNPAEFDLVEIATALGRIARFTGHGRQRLSVAEHCVNCVDWTRSVFPSSPRPRLAAILMHDAAEAYLGDVASPLKAILPDYKVLEWRMMLAIGHRYGIDFRAEERAIKTVDQTMTITEATALFGPVDWPGFPDPVPWFPIRFLSPTDATDAFLEMARDLEVE